MSNFTDAFPGGKIANRIDDESFSSFVEGWAKVPFNGNAPHYYRDITDRVHEVLPGVEPDVRGFEALCGFLAFTDTKGGLMTPGNYPLCKRCMKKAPRWATREERNTTVPDEVLRVLKNASRKG